MTKQGFRLKNKFNLPRSILNYKLNIFGETGSELITYFDKTEMDIYKNAIKMYEAYPYEIHQLIIDEERCGLNVIYNPKIIKDCAPFWAICDTDRYLKGKCRFNYYEFDSVEEAYSHYYKYYDYSYPLTPRKKYLKYLKTKPAPETFEAILKKELLKDKKRKKGKGCKTK